MTARILLLLIAFVSFPAIAYQQLRRMDAVWPAAELQFVALAYVVLGAVVFVIVLGLVRNVRRLGAAARSIRIGAPTAPTFAALNRVPEFAGITAEFDRMAHSLRLAAEESRSAADETAHAFKTPIATIAHALMPLRSAVPADNARARRSVELIEQTAARLDALVVATRRMEQARSRVMHPPRWRLDLGAFIRDAVASKLAELDDAAGRLKIDADSGIYVYGNDDVLETIIDRLIDNAVSASAPDRSILVTVREREGQAVCSIDDEGPGVPADTVDRIFERYTSYHPAGRDAHASDTEDSEQPSRYGIGLWVVRRNVEALEGKVWAENRPQGGLRIVITLPLA